MDIYNWAVEYKGKVSTFVSRLETLQTPITSKRQKKYLEVEIRTLRDELAAMKVPQIRQWAQRREMAGPSMTRSEQVIARRALLIYLKGSQVGFAVDLHNPDCENACLGSECRVGFPIDMAVELTVEEFVQGIDQKALSAWCSNNGWSCRLDGDRLKFEHLEH